MAGRDPVAVVAGSSRIIGERALSDIGDLIAGLDQLELLLLLPHFPQIAAPGVLFGNFTLLARLGSGAHGNVFLAQDARLGRRVVVKVPQPVVLADAEARARFVREARAAAVLDHPRIVPIFEAGEVGALSYLVAGFINGPTLATWLAERTRPLGSNEATRLVASLARSVQHAHERGILHCDLKPGNILMSGEVGDGFREPVITDFGMARILTDDPSLTRTFQQAGTPLYMSPEQARGNWRGLTARTDVYALGAILFELLSGRTPFLGETGPDILKQVQLDPAPCVGAVNPEVPRDLRAICRRCLEKDPQDRYHSAAALAEDLDRFRGGYPVDALKLHLLSRAAKWTRRNPLGTAAAVTFVGLITGFGLLLAEWWSVGIKHAADLRVAAADVNTANARRHDAEQRAAAGDYISTFEKTRIRRNERHPDWPTLNLADFHRLILPDTIADLAPLRSEIAAALGGVDLGTPRVIAQGFKAYNPAFSPDGKTLALGSWHSDETGMCSVLLIDVETGAVRKTLRYEGDREWNKRYAQQQGKPPASYDGCRSLIFRPDGRFLVLGTRSGWLVRWNLASRTLSPVRWGTAPYQDNTSRDRINRLAFALGHRLLVATDDSFLSAWDTTHGWELTAYGIETYLELIRPARAGDPLWIRDMRDLREAYTGVRWLSAPAPLRFGGHAPVAAPGGRLFFGMRNGGRTIRQFAVPPDGSGEVEEYVAPFVIPGDLETEEGHVDDLLVSPDGQFLATASEGMRHLKLWSVATSQLLSKRSLNAGSLRLAFSPDSQTLAVCDENQTLLYPILSSRVASTQALQPYEILDAAIDRHEIALLCRYRDDYSIAQDRCGFVQRITLSGFPGWADAKIRDFDFRLFGESRIAIEPGGPSFAYPRGDDVVWLGRDWTGGPHIHSASRLHDLQFGPGRRLWLAAGNSLIGWGADESNRTTTFTDPAGGIPPFANRIAVDSSIVLVGRSDGVVNVIDPNTGDFVRTFPLFNQKITAIALVGDGATAIAGSATGAVRCFNIHNGTIAAKLPNAHQDSIDSIAVGPRGWFATASQDRQVKIWTPTGQEVLTLPQSRPVRRVYWSKDGTRLTILCDCERGLKQWNIDRLKESFEKLGIPSMLP